MPAKKTFPSIRVRGAAEFDGPLSGTGFNALMDQLSGATLGLRWFHARDISFEELQGDLSNVVNDICILQSGTWLHDITFFSSDDFNDAETDAGGMQHVGWGDYNGADDSNGFAFSFPRPIDSDGVDLWWPMHTQHNGLRFGHGELTAKLSMAGVQTGRPVYVADQNAAGPLRCGTGGLSGNSTAGHVEVWILIQGPDPLPADGGGGIIITPPPPRS
jgi:hypothetical protein